MIDSIVNNEIRCGMSAPLHKINLNENEDMFILNASLVGASYAIKKYALKR